MKVSSGMGYLEQCDMIHKDVAARNVLVSTDNRVKISMCGVSRLIEESIYESTGNKGLRVLKD